MINSLLSSELSEPIEAFLAFLELERGLSKHTSLAYSKDLYQLAHFLGKKGILSWSLTKHEDLASWLEQLAQCGLNPRSQSRKLSALRSFCNYYSEFSKDKTAQNPSSLLEGPKTRRKLPEVLSEAEVNALLVAPSMNHPQGLRDRAFLELFYSSGLRVTELCSLELHCINLEDAYLRTIGKGSKERLVPIGSSALEAIKNYLAAGRPAFVKAKTGSHLFLSERGGPLSRKTVWHWIKIYARQVGIAKPVKPHLLRHAFASHLLKHGADLRAIQEMLGHADISTTQIYTTVQTDSLESEHKAYHPMGKMCNKSHSLSI